MCAVAIWSRSLCFFLNLRVGRNRHTCSPPVPRMCDFHSSKMAPATSFWINSSKHVRLIYDGPPPASPTEVYPDASLGHGLHVANVASNSLLSTTLPAVSLEAARDTDPDLASEAFGFRLPPFLSIPMGVSMRLRDLSPFRWRAFVLDSLGASPLGGFDLPRSSLAPWHRRPPLKVGH